MTPEISEKIAAFKRELTFIIVSDGCMEVLRGANEAIDHLTVALARSSERSDEAQKSHFAKVAEFVTGGDTSEAGMAKAERDYALHCLEREMALCQQADARLADALEIIKPFALLCDLDVKADQGDLDSVYPMVAVGRLRAARAFLDAVSGSTEAGK
jgi:hypothetical protein